MSSPVSDRVLRSQAAALPAIRFLMQPRDLTHPEACDFVAGNPQEPPLPGYVEAVQAALVPRSLSWYAYGPPDQEAIEVAASALGSRLGLALDPADVFLTRGAASGLEIALRTVIDPGDQVVFLSPPWFFYEAIITAQLAEPVRVPLTRPGFDLDLDAIAGALTPRTRAVIVNTPHNPSGRVLPEDQLEALGALLEQASERGGRRVYLISDEAYARILFDGRRMITPGRFYPATFMLHTYSKTLLAPSQRLGYMAMPPSMPHREQLRFALLMVSMAAAGIPDTGMQHALPVLEGMTIDVAAIERRRDRMVDALRELGYELASPEGTFYLQPRSPVPDAAAFCEWLARKRVYALPGDAFELPGYFRLSLTATDAMVDRALPVFGEAMERFGSQ